MTLATPIETATFLSYMRDVAGYEQTLQELGLMWRLIDASARMNCPAEAKTILSSLAATRSGFSALESALVSTLVQEKVANVQRAIGTKAQYIIDIIVRNLFERTADVGFLATDRELCRFVAGLDDDRAAICNRLRDYRDKYTVYDDILLLDPRGKVLARIDAGAQQDLCNDALVAATLASDSYVETFRATDLQPHRRRSLVYSRRMHHPDTGAVIGLLCLCFGFEAEMASIFASHRDVEDHSIMLLLDERNRVVASSEPRWIGIDATVPSNRDGKPLMLPYCGRYYLVRTFGSPGYQGYAGPAGWQGQVMIPAEIAFNGTGADAVADLAPAHAAGLLSHASTFCPALDEIMKANSAAAATIQRIVWNGHLLTSGQSGALQKLKSILDQISETGSRSNALFARSINDLFKTVLSSGMRDAQFTAHLLVDLLDRNLYERSDDCRWWALTTELRAGIGMPVRDATTMASINQVLAHVNGLYTVYTRIFLYDRNGVIIATTGAGDDETPGLVGECIEPACLASVLGLADHQQYHVSPFAATNLYGDRPTYVYHAALRDIADENRIVGGIGIVFDSAPEMLNMLKAGLGGRPGMSAFFIDRNGAILSSTDPDYPVGSLLPLAPDLLQLGNGGSVARIVIHGNQYAIAGCSVSNGYREFKNTDGYQDDIIAIVFEPLGRVVADEAAGSAVASVHEEAEIEQSRDYATFFTGKSLLAIDAAFVSQALPCSEMRPASMGGRPERIGLINFYNSAGISELIWVFDLTQLLGRAALEEADGNQVIVVEWEGHTIGLLVDALHEVPRFALPQITRMPFGSLEGSVLITQVIKANQGTLLIQLLDPACLFRLLLGKLGRMPLVTDPPRLNAA